MVISFEYNTEGANNMVWYKPVNHPRLTIQQQLFNDKTNCVVFLFNSRPYPITSDGITKLNFQYPALF